MQHPVNFLDPATLTPARIEITVKFNELPKNPVTIPKNNWVRFYVNTGHIEMPVVQCTIRPGLWAKLVNASREFPMWVCSISGQLGLRIKRGFILENPKVQIFEKKPKEPKAD